MKRRAFLVLSLMMIMLTLLVGGALALSEAEPNDGPGNATTLPVAEFMYGSVAPSGDLDYYAIDGIGTSWGFIALLNTTESTASTDAVLAALGSDGSTLMRQDAGSWEYGSGIALQSYAEGDTTYYLRVNAADEDTTVTTYTLRYYNTILNLEGEAEPNDTRSTGTPSSFSHEGELSDYADDRQIDDLQDCYAFHGRAGDSILIALNGDPDSDGISSVDAMLTLVDPDDNVIEISNRTGIAGQEFIEYSPLPEDGKYAYCVAAVAISSALATYHVGIVRNGDLYRPAYVQDVISLDPRDGLASPGETLTFRLAYTNTSPVSILGTIRMSAMYSTTILNYVSASPSPATVESGRLVWTDQNLAPGEAFVATITFDGLVYGSDTLKQTVFVDYFDNTTADELFYCVCRSRFIPIIIINKD